MFQRWWYALSLMALVLSHQRSCWADEPARHGAKTRPVPTATIWLAGVALVSFATSGALLTSALSIRRAADQCADGCPKGQADAIKQQALTADIVGGAGVGAAGLALYSYFTRPGVLAVPTTALASSPPSFSVASVRSGVVAQLAWRF